MSPNGRHFYEKEWFIPVTVSILCHLFFILAALFIHFQEDEEKPDANLLEFHLNKVKASPSPSGKPGGGAGYPGSTKKETQFLQPRSADDMSTLSRNQARAVDQKVTAENQEEKIPLENNLRPVPSSARSLDTLIFENENIGAAHQLRVKQESLSEFYQKEAEKSVKASPPSGEGLLRSLSKPLGKVQLYSPENMAVDPEEGMPGFTPSPGSGSGIGGGGIARGHGIGSGIGNGPGGPGISEGYDEGGSGITKYEPLDNFLDVEVYIYTEPLPKDGGQAADKQKYFMLKIYAKPGSEALKVMPKEILFTIDCSLSISKDRLDEFKRGIRYCLTHLNRGDVFNIVAFKDSVTFFSTQSVPADPEVIKRAERFVSDLTASQTTDVYSAFSKIIEKSLARRPSNIMLISDGRPTFGVVNSRELINSVTRLNKNVRPVFVFTGGAKVNRYLLDFIAYQNRAWSQFVRRTGDIHKGLGGFYDKIKDPVFLNLRYQLNNLDAEDVYPKALPDFYRNAEFTLYGTYTDENDFSMQLLGDAGNETRELIFSRALNDAKKGTEEIKRGYAFNKIYYLISRMTAEGQTPALRAEIDALSKKYGIQTPYSVELEKRD